MKTTNLLFILIFITSIIACKKDDLKDSVIPITLDCNSFNTDGNHVLKNRGEGIDYTVDCILPIKGDLTIEPGVVIQFTSDAGFKIDGTGSLNATGTIEKNIKFIGKDNVKGSWLGLYFDSYDIKNSLSHCTIENAGGNSFNSNGDKGAIIVWADSKLAINDSKIINSAEYGINANYSGAKLSLTNNLITGCNMPMFLNAEYVGDISGGTYTGNTTDAIYIETSLNYGKILTAQTWEDLGIPYRIKSGGYIVVDEVYFQIAAGVTIEFETETGIKIKSGASFSAIGTATEQILFTGVIKQAGAWESIQFISTSSPLNEISYAKIEYGGESRADGVIYMDYDPDLKLSNVYFSNIEACAIFDGPKFDFNPSSQVINPNLTLEDVTYTSIENQNGTTTESSNLSYCFGG